LAGKNLFGGGNARSVYTPMSEVEQELVSRLVAAGDLEVHVVGWGVVYKPRVTFGDLRLTLTFRLNFDRPEVPMPLYFLDLELRTGSGILLFKERQPTTYGGNPVSVASGVFFDLIWDIGIKSIDPNLVKALMPGTIGLTSRLQDKDTREFTQTGNMRLNSSARQVLSTLRGGEESLKRLTQKRLKTRT